MKNRIANRFRQLKKLKKKALIPFITAGDPSLKATEQLVLAFEKSGADIVELGVPFSDPIADGPTIQASSQRALDKGVTLNKIFDLVKAIRKKSDIPIALMTYYNPIFHYGEKKFIQKAKSVGVDGLIIPDLPPEEGQSLNRIAKSSDIAMVYFLAPTTVTKRVPKIATASTGFIYYVSVTGVTGARSVLPAQIANDVKRAKKYTDKPVCVGFGISTPQQVKTISKVADGVIVGSAIIKHIEKNKGRSGLVSHVAKYVRSLSRAL